MPKRTLQQKSEAAVRSQEKARKLTHDAKIATLLSCIEQKPDILDDVIAFSQMKLDAPSTPSTSMPFSHASPMTSIMPAPPSHAPPMSSIMPAPPSHAPPMSSQESVAKEEVDISSKVIDSRQSYQVGRLAAGELKYILSSIHAKLFHAWSLKGYCTMKASSPSKTRMCELIEFCSSIPPTLSLSGGTFATIGELGKYIQAEAHKLGNRPEAIMLPLDWSQYKPEHALYVIFEVRL